MAESLALANEVVSWTRTELGKHHLSRLVRIRDDYRARAEDVTISDSESRAYTMKASAYDDELSYYRTAEQIVSNPSIVKRLTDKLRAKGDSSV